MVNDPIADFLARIKNAVQRKKEEVSMPSNKKIVEIARILKEEGFILDYKVEKNEPQDVLYLKLKYVNGVSAIRDVKRVSKPGVRIYLGYNKIPRISGGTGIAIFSTPKGIMTGKNAKKNKIGGEFWCKIW